MQVPLPQDGCQMIYQVSIGEIWEGFQTLKAFWLSPLTLWQEMCFYSHFIDVAAEPQKQCDLFTGTQLVVELGVRVYPARFCPSCSLCPDGLLPNLGYDWLLLVIQMFPLQTSSSPHLSGSHYPMYFLNSTYVCLKLLILCIWYFPALKCELHEIRDNPCLVHHFTPSTCNGACHAVGAQYVLNDGNKLGTEGGKEANIT